MTSEPLKLLYVTYVSPFPTNSGERIRTVNLIAALRALGYEVDAVVGNYDRIDLATRNGDGIRFHEIPFSWPRMRQSAGVYFRPHATFIAQMRALHRARGFTAIFLDYGFMGAQIGALSALGVPIVLGTHNVESDVTAQVPARSFPAAIGLRLRQAIERAHERRFFGRADAVVCVSEEDRQAYAAYIPSDRLFVVPNFIDVPDVYGNVEREDRIIMTGSFGNFQNVMGLRWFIRNVWDKTLQDRASVCIAGKQSCEAVGEFADVPGIVALGPLDDLLGEIAKARVAIVPLLHGGGTRLKCLEAMTARTPVVTTAKGCEGIDHDGAFLVADEPASFRAAILYALDRPAEARQMAEAARKTFDRRYSRQASTLLLKRVLDHVATSDSRAAVANRVVAG